MTIPSINMVLVLKKFNLSFNKRRNGVNKQELFIIINESIGFHSFPYDYSFKNKIASNPKIRVTEEKKNKTKQD